MSTLDEFEILRSRKCVSYWCVWVELFVVLKRTALVDSTLDIDEEVIANIAKSLPEVVCLDY